MKTFSFGNFSTNAHSHTSIAISPWILMFTVHCSFVQTKFSFTHSFIMVRSISILMMMTMLCKKSNNFHPFTEEEKNNYVWVKCRVYWKRDDDLMIKGTWMYILRTCVAVSFLLFFLCLFSLFIVGCDAWTGWLSKIGYESETAICIRFIWKSKSNDQVKFWQEKIPPQTNCILTYPGTNKRQA